MTVFCFCSFDNGCLFRNHQTITLHLKIEAPNICQAVVHLFTQHTDMLKNQMFYQDEMEGYPANFTNFQFPMEYWDETDWKKNVDYYTKNPEMFLKHIDTPDTIVGFFIVPEDERLFRILQSHRLVEAKDD